jgi:hypothetical protein
LAGKVRSFGFTGFLFLFHPDDPVILSKAPIEILQTGIETEPVNGNGCVSEEGALITYLAWAVIDHAFRVTVRNAG